MVFSHGLGSGTPFFTKKISKNKKDFCFIPVYLYVILILLFSHSEDVAFGKLNLKYNLGLSH